MSIDKNGENMIPKVIHYCWFGYSELPESAKRCIQSWKEYLPDFEIKEWNENNYDVNKIPYIKEAYAQKKYAFVSDYARFDILYNEGGIYFDTDVELVKSIDDILADGDFFGMETDTCKGKIMYNVAPGLGMASKGKNDIYKQVLDGYEKRHFCEINGKEDVTTICAYVTCILNKSGFDCEKNIFSKIDGINIYPTDYFCPMSYSTGVLTMTENTRSIHWYSASWKNEKEQHYIEKRRKLIKKYGIKRGNKCADFLEIPNKVFCKVKEKGFWGMIKYIFILHKK